MWAAPRRPPEQGRLQRSPGPLHARIQARCADRAPNTAGRRGSDQAPIPPLLDEANASVAPVTSEIDIRINYSRTEPYTPTGPPSKGGDRGPLRRRGHLDRLGAHLADVAACPVAHGQGGERAQPVWKFRLEQPELLEDGKDDDGNCLPSSRFELDGDTRTARTRDRSPDPRPADLRGEPATRDLEEGGVEACRPGDEEWVRGHRVLSANECRIRAGRRKASGDGGERGSVGGEPAPVDAARCGSEIDAERLLKRRADRLLTWVRRLHVAVQRPSHDRTRREHRGVL